jgi:hypothetical protein
LKKDEEVISGSMTAALAAYSYVSPRINHLIWLTKKKKTAWSSCASVRKSLSLHQHEHQISLSAWKVDPRNYLLFACHATNTTTQLTQGYRFVNYWHRGGKERKILEAESSPDTVKGSVTEAVKAAQATSQSTK